MPRRQSSWNKPEYAARNLEIGEMLRKARSKKGLKQQQCAEYIGVSRQHYSAVENGTASLLVPQFEDLLRYLDVPTHWVWENPPPNAAPQRRIAVELLPGEQAEIIVTAQRTGPDGPQQERGR
jgi:transcriptional regulator with XRE-family HTH domain